MDVIEDKHYEDTVLMLMKDPIIIDMAGGVYGMEPDNLKGFSFINAALQEYNKRGGQIETHIGGPAEAIRRLLDKG